MKRMTLAAFVALAACAEPSAPLLLDGTYMVTTANGLSMPARFDGREDGCEHYDILGGDMEIADGAFTKRLQWNKVCGGASIHPAPVATREGSVSRDGHALKFDADGFDVPDARVMASGGLWVVVAGAVRSDTLEYARR